ncbi:MAG: SsrA-binding protein SmpB [Candidatus Saccharicenans sp.]|nr:MAG: SsrA-binding protein [Candidatus Aminicenantes bacterium]HEK86427.1 SsrA-binding protein SmpB [Candidatus Aminicenantes bacterium]
MKIMATNKNAYHNYEILETFEAGIALTGSEVKSIREGRVSLKESYADFNGHELFLLNCNISPYNAANIFNHEPLRPRQLLLHKRELKRLAGKVQEKGLTLIPLKVYLNDRGLVKIELALGRGKKIYEKREDIKKRDVEREIQAELKKRRF